MAGLWNLLPLYLDGGNDGLNLSDFLNAVTDHQSLAVNDDVDSPAQLQVVATVNAMLNKPESRIEGALLLDVLVRQCSTDVFTTNCASWAQQMSQMLQGQRRFEGGIQACNVLSKLLELASPFPDVSRQLSTGVISNLITSLCDPNLRKKSQLTERSLNCLRCCLKFFPGACNQQKTTIEEHLMALADVEEMTPGTAVQATWTRCVAALPCMGSSGPQGLQHRANWMNVCSQTLHSIHDCLGGLFRHIDEVKEYETHADGGLHLAPFEHKNPLALLHAEKHRLANLYAAMAQLLTEPSTAVKNVPVDRVLDTVSRALTVNSSSLLRAADSAMKTNVERLTLAALMPDVHSSALQLLTALIGCARALLVARAADVMRLFVQVLEWTLTTNGRADLHRPYAKLRGHAYHGLCVWLSVSRLKCDVSTWGDALMAQLLSDIVVRRDAVQLQRPTQHEAASNGGGSGGRKKKGGGGDGGGGLIVWKAEAGANADVCRDALRCLVELLAHCGPLLKTQHHKEVQETVLAILIDFRNEVPLETLQPYTDPTCRALLYKVLELLVLCPQPNWPVPLQYARTLLRAGRNDASVVVAGTCASALAAVEAVARPTARPLHLALSYDQLRPVFASPEDPPTAAAAPAPISKAPDAVKPSLLAVRQPEESPLLMSTLMPIETAPRTASAPILKETVPRVSEPALPAPAAADVVKAAPDVVKAVADVVKAAPDVAKAEAGGKRPLPDAADAAPTKVAKGVTFAPKVDLPFGTDQQDDDVDVDAMLASFHDTPAE